MRDGGKGGGGMRVRTPTVYILAGQRRGTIYIGVTSDPLGRWWQHREKQIKGFTSRYGVTRLVHVEFFGDMEHAILREKQLKRWHRDWKTNALLPQLSALISGNSVQVSGFVQTPTR
ncbi:GIY-YIG nuclease family protein [Sphingomonas sp.]|jgi:putative endonuclease|uniref:GIY-YIG nuclease family protein n=1 Tax=Sphingomonas sp. TaxID=28214 RepID=UPI002D7F8FC5|nr:GIY-YIG nuclease family protein [Sphingomonas sp.]HEU0042982.1 GIY-YIG nuclease family protein [Sphingomonas sp.]